MIGIGAAPAPRPRRHRRGAALERRQRLCAERNRRLDRHRSGRLHPDPLSALGDGPRQHDRAADDDCRGAAVRLVESADRICLAQPQPPREQGLWSDMFSHGSRSVRVSQKKMQQVGASARERLIAAAAARWNVPAAECSAAQSVVTHTAFGPHAALRRTRRRRGEGHARQRAGDQDARSVHLHPASRCRASTWSTRSTARPNSASTRKFRAWCSPRSRPARSPAASSRASMTPCSPARRACSRW